MASRWLGVSTKPPVPGVEASTKVSGDTHSALPVVLTTCCSEIPLSRSRLGSTWTCSCRSRSPQITTFATPGIPSRRGLMFQCASTDMSVRETSFDESPTIISRLVDESGWIMAGGDPTCGSPPIWVRRS